MNGIVAYSRPRGILGHFVFTVVVNHSVGLKEKVEIQVTREDNMFITNETTTYSCHHCGLWATINTHIKLQPSEHTVNGELEFFRFDNVEPGDVMYITMSDPDLLFYQTAQFFIRQNKIDRKYNILLTRGNKALNKRPNKIYDIELLNWDKHLQQATAENRPLRVEEELIEQTMQAEKITITDLLLQPAGQVPALKEGYMFVEGELRYLSDD